MSTADDLAAITTLVGIASVGGTPTAQQLAAAQAAVASLGSALTVPPQQPAQPATPPPAKLPPGVWVSAPVAGLAALATGLVGGLVGFSMKRKL